MNPFLLPALKRNGILVSLILVAMITSCASPQPAATDELHVLATTTIVADIVAQVGGETISLMVLLPEGSDPHVFTPRPQDAAALADAELIFANGAGLEVFLPPLIESTAPEGTLVELSADLELLGLPGADHDHEHDGVDPHTWMDPNNVVIWTQTVAAALAESDPEHAAVYQSNAADYIAQLQELDTWIRLQVEQIPAENRLLVADHTALGYFAARYGFTQAGSITASFSTESSPTAQELAALEDEILRQGIKAIFYTEAANAAIVEQIARDTGIIPVWLQVGSLTAAGGVAPNYLELMRYNVNGIVTALK